jgi:hypothetical protein
MLKITEYTPKCTGHFKLRSVNKYGGTILQIEEDNLIVNKHGEILASLLGGSGGTAISKIGFGTGSTAAAVTDTGLTNAAYYDVMSIETPTGHPTWVQFNWYLAYDELVGTSIAEFGLFNSTNMMFSRLVYAAIPKSLDVALEGEWVIKFT